MSNSTEGGLYVLVMMKGKLTFLRSLGVLSSLWRQEEAVRSGPTGGEKGPCGAGDGGRPVARGMAAAAHSTATCPQLATAHVDLEVRQKFAIKIRGLGVSRNPLSIAFLPPHLFSPPKQETRKEDADLIVKT